MAHTQTIYTCAFFLALVACNVILFTEARQLKSMQQKYNSIAVEREMGTKHGSQAINSNQNPEEHINDLQALGVNHISSGHYSAAGKKEILPPITPNENLGFGNSDAGYKDDFQATTPDKSPDVGHPGHRNDIQTKAIGIGPVDSHSVERDPDDIRRTNPGHSPGVGHLGHKNDIQTEAIGSGPGDSHSVAGDTDDIRRTNPGHSPGIGHSKDDFRSTMLGNSPGFGHGHKNDSQTKAIGTGLGDSHSVAKDRDDIRGTNPGHSPGVGHYKDGFQSTMLGNSPGVGHPGHKNDSQTKSIGIGPDDSHSIAGDTDDIQRTDPGHSPGIGHSFQTTNAEPNA